jgi:hypothetical protein
MGSDRFFFVRLVGPRPSVLKDMSDDERAVKGKHGEYWRRQLAAGKVIVFGPVADPKGAWGLGVVRAQDEAELKRFEAEDPAMTGIPGMRYEVLPMVTAVFAS